MKNRNHKVDEKASEQEIPTVSPVIGDGEDAHRVVRVGDWKLTAWVGRGEEEPRIRDLDLAERLGYERPADVRDLIKRMMREGKLNNIHQIRTVRKWEGQVAARPACEFWLTEAQALKVVAKSETPLADALLDEVIRVYVLARKGLLPQQGLPFTIEGLGAALHPRIHQIVVDANAPLAARIAEGHNAIIKFIDEQALVVSQMRGEIASLKDHIGVIATGIKITHEMVVSMDKRVLELKDYLVSSTGSIGEHRAEVLRVEIDYIANAWVQLGWSKKPTLRSAKTDIMKDVLGGVHWTGSGQTLDGLPVADYPHVRARLKALKTRADRTLAAIKRKGGQGASGRLRQGELFADKPENKPN